jgi:hypothetical protein
VLSSCCHIYSRPAPTPLSLQHPATHASLNSGSSTQILGKAPFESGQTCLRDTQLVNPNLNTARSNSERPSGSSFDRVPVQIPKECAALQSAAPSVSGRVSGRVGGREHQPIGSLPISVPRLFFHFVSTASAVLLPFQAAFGALADWYLRCKVTDYGVSTCRSHAFFCRFARSSPVFRRMSPC